MIANKGSRKSKNLIDVRDDKEKKKYETKINLADNSKRQIFQPDVSKNITRVANTVVNKNRNSNGPGAKTLRSPPGKTPTSRFKKGK